jgi:arylsulfatase A-like enzyme
MNKTTRREFLSKTGIAISGLMLGQAFLPLLEKYSPDIKQPNIVFILTDDQATWGVGAYGNPEVSTPNIDSIAKDGMIFKQAFTSPVCSPSRAMILTGKYPHQVDISDWITPEDTNGITVGVPTIGNVLKQAGYTTALFGKWHVGNGTEYFPTRRGFDYFLGCVGGGKNKELDPELYVNNAQKKFKGFLTDILIDHASEYIEKRSSTPFFLMISTRRPHAPYVPVPDQDTEFYKNKKITVPSSAGKYAKEMEEERRQYYASIRTIDRRVGDFLNVLKSQGLYDNTIIIFMGDNGYMLGEHGVFSKGNAVVLGSEDWSKRRPNLWEYSVKIPLIIRWPGVIETGSSSNMLVNSIDFFPTFMGIGRRIGTHYGKKFNPEGRDLYIKLKNEKKSWRQTIFMEYDMLHGGIANMRMIRTDDWKLILHYERGGKSELYHLAIDPDEQYNLYGETEVKKTQEHLCLLLKQWEKGTNDKFYSEKYDS